MVRHTGLKVSLDSLSQYGEYKKCPTQALWGSTGHTLTPPAGKSAADADPLPPSTRVFPHRPGDDSCQQLGTQDQRLQPQIRERWVCIHPLGHRTAFPSLCQLQSEHLPPRNDASVSDMQSRPVPQQPTPASSCSVSPELWGPGAFPHLTSSGPDPPCEPGRVGLGRPRRGEWGLQELRAGESIQRAAA